MAISRIGATEPAPRRRSGGAGAVERGTRPVHDRPPCGRPRRRRRHGPRRGGERPPRGPWRHQLSKSATKAPIEPERARRNVDIPRFHSRPIPARGAFVADLDTPTPQPTPQAPPAPLGRPQNNLPDTALALPRRRADPRPCTAIPGEKGSVSLQGARCSPTCHLMESAPGRCVRASRSGLHRVAKVRRRIRPGTASCMTRSSESGARSSIIPFTPHPTASSGLMSPRTHWSAQRAKSSSLKGRAS